MERFQGSKIHSSFDARKMVENRGIRNAAQGIKNEASVADRLQQYGKCGIYFHGKGMDSQDSHSYSRNALANIRAAYTASMDSYSNSLTTPSIPTPVQFLQTFIPGIVEFQTAPRMIDELIGMVTIGSFEDEQLIIRASELFSQAVPYQDLTPVPFSSYNIIFNVRTVVRFEQGMQVGYLENARLARINVNTDDEKRRAAQRALEIQRQYVGMYGYNSNSSLTYGMLNEPQLSNYVAVPAGASGQTQWAYKTYNEIWNDILNAVTQLQIASGGRIDAFRAPMTLALANTVIPYLNVQNALSSKTIKSTIMETFSNIRIIPVPEFSGANGGLNVGYLYAEEIQDEMGSTDDGKTWMQLVPAKSVFLGVRKDVKYYAEDYANALGGVYLKRPVAVTRFTGI